MNFFKKKYIYIDESTTGRYVSITIVKKRIREKEKKKKDGGKSLGCGEWGLSKVRFG